MPRPQRDMDSQTLIAKDKAEAALRKPVRPVLARAHMLADVMFNDPGSAHGPSIKCPHIYEALRRKGYSKTKAAKISNAKC